MVLQVSHEKTSKVSVSGVFPLNKGIRHMSDLWSECEQQWLFLTDRHEWGCTFTNVFDDPSKPKLVVTQLIFL